MGVPWPCCPVCSVAPDLHSQWGGPTTSLEGSEQRRKPTSKCVHTNWGAANYLPRASPSAAAAVTRTCRVLHEPRTHALINICAMQGRKSWHLTASAALPLDTVQV